MLGLDDGERPWDIAPMKNRDLEMALRDTGIRLTIPLRPIVKKNRRPIHRSGGRVRVGKDRKLADWESDAAMALRAQWGGLPSIEGPLNAAIVSYLGPRQTGGNTPDASNLYEAPQDALQAARVVVDDVQIVSHDGSFRHHDPKNPRVEITLTRPRTEQ